MRTRLHSVKIPGNLSGEGAGRKDLVCRDLIFHEGFIAAVEAPTPEGSVCGGEESAINGAGWIAWPAPLDAHVHLDKAHTWDRSPNLSGTFAEALEVLGADRRHWSENDLFRRADFSLRSAFAHGTGAIRSHVDTGHGKSPMAWEVLADLKLRWSERLELQLVSLCGVADYSGPGGEKLADLPLQFGASALGGMPLMNPDLPRQLERLLDLACEREVGLDLHVDESGDPGARCLQAIAEAVLKKRFSYPVTCGHCCSLAVQDAAAQRATLDLVAAAGLRIVSLPLCNLYLQDRRGRAEAWRPLTPGWRGLTLVRDFLDAGVTIACASDNVRDAFYAYGDFDLFEVWRYSLRLAHLDSHMAKSLEVVTRQAAKVMGLPDRESLAPGCRADLLLFRADSFSQLASRDQVERRFIRGGIEEERRLPDYTELSAVQEIEADGRIGGVSASSVGI